jgi:hypothetical protein
MKKESEKIQLKNKIKGVLKKLVAEGLNINRLDEDDIANINSSLNEAGIIDWNITALNDNSAYWLQCDYYSKAIGKTIIFDYDVDYDSDGETIDLMAESIYQLDLDIINFEARLSLK